MPRIALNGLGRIGKLALRDLIDTGAGGEIVLINDSMGTPDQHALLMEFDSVHGRWPRAISHDADSLTLGGQRMTLTNVKGIEDLPLAAMGVDLVIDATGVFKTEAKIAPYFAAGVKKVIVSAPTTHVAAIMSRSLAYASRSRTTGRRQLFETVRRGGISLLENVVRPQDVQRCIPPRRRSWPGSVTGHL